MAGFGNCATREIVTGCIARDNVFIAVHLVSPENIKYVYTSVPASGNLLPVANDLTVRSVLAHFIEVGFRNIAL
jgi:hypothetical protein